MVLSLQTSPNIVHLEVSLRPALPLLLLPSPDLDRGAGEEDPATRSPGEGSFMSADEMAASFEAEREAIEDISAHNMDAATRSGGTGWRCVVTSCRATNGNPSRGETARSIVPAVVTRARQVPVR